MLLTIFYDPRFFSFIKDKLFTITINVYLMTFIHMIFKIYVFMFNLENKVLQTLPGFSIWFLE